MKKYKYKGHIIVKIFIDLDENNKKCYYVYKIYKGDKLLNEALTLSKAKEYIDNNYEGNLFKTVKEYLDYLDNEIEEMGNDNFSKQRVLDCISYFEKKDYISLDDAVCYVLKVLQK